MEKSKKWFIAYMSSISDEGTFTSSQSFGNAIINTSKTGDELYLFLTQQAEILAKENNKGKSINGTLLTSICPLE